MNRKQALRLAKATTCTCGEIVFASAYYDHTPTDLEFFEAYEELTRRGVDNGGGAVVLYAREQKQNTP